LGILAPTAWNLTGFWRKSLISCSSSTASSAPATSANVVFGVSLVTCLALEQQQQEDQERQEADQQADQEALLGDVGVELDGVGVPLSGDEVVDVVGGTEGVGGSDLVAALDLVADVEVEGLFLVVDRRGLDVAVRELGKRDRGPDLLIATLAGEEGREREGDQDDEDDPEPHGAEDLLTFHTPMPGAGSPAARPPS
jgi:hypothetical protein